MSQADLWRLDGTAQAALIRHREITPVELLDAAIARIERLNPRINAVIMPLYDLARRQAADVDPDAPFAGVPMLIKDAGIEIEGTPHYLGTRVLRDLGYRSAATTEMAHRFQRAGFVIAGKTNCPELSAGITTEPAAFGPTRNPWDLGGSAGGSSGGSAAAVAAGMTSIAHGGDATGSLRYPAACCGVATLKPTRGRMPPGAPAGTADPSGVWVSFVLARSVRDLAGALDAVGGPGPGQPYVAPPPTRPYTDELRPPDRPLRVGLMTRDVMSNMAVDPECVAAVERTGAALAAMGYHVEQAHPPALDGLWLRTIKPFAVIGVVIRAAQVRWLASVAGRDIVEGDLEPETLTTAAAASQDSAVDYVEAAVELERLVRPIHDWWAEGNDILITPTLRQPPWPLGSTGGALDAGTFPGAFSLTGQPAMSLPLHWTPAGLPVGVQFIAAYGREDLLFNIATQLEDAIPWHDRWPPIATDPTA